MMSIDDRISEAIGRQIDDASIRVPSAADIGAQGRRRTRRRQGMLGLVSAALLLTAIVGAGSALDGRRSTELATAVGATVEEFQLQVPAEFARADDGFVAFAGMPGAEAGVFRLLSSDDGVDWEPIPGSNLDDWPAGRPETGTWEPFGLGLAVHDTTVHLVAGWLEPLGAGEARPDAAVTGDDEVEATLTVAWARFDRDTGEWTTTIQRDVADLPDAQQRVMAVDAATASIGMVLNVTLQADPLTAALIDQGMDHDDLCGVQGGPVVMELRQCGSAEVREVRVPLSATTSARSLVLFADTSAGEPHFEVVQTPSLSFHPSNATYSFDDGLGIASGLPNGYEGRSRHLGETTDGDEWTDISSDAIARLMSVAARGDERVALSSMNANRGGPDRPIRILWYSESGEPDLDRVHVVADDEGVEQLVATYRVNQRELAAANPELDLDALATGTEVVIPDTDPNGRNWQSIDLEPVYGDTPMSTVYFQGVVAGPGGFVLPVLHGLAPGDSRPELDDTTPFSIEADGLVFEGSSPFGPATLRTADGEIIETWFHFEAARPDRHGTVDIERHELLIDVFDNAGVRTGGAAFDIDEWFAAVAPDEPDLRVDLLWSPDGIDWQMLDQLDGYPQSLAVDDDGVAVLLTGRRFPTTLRIDFPD